MAKIEGLIAAPYAPFDEKGHLKSRLIPKYAEYLRRCGVRGVFVNGTTGEGAALNTRERLRNAESWCQQKKDGFKVIIHVGYTDLNATRELARHAHLI